MLNRLPSTRPARLDIFRPVIDVCNLTTSATGHLLEELVHFRLWLQRLHFMRQHVAGEAWPKIIRVGHMADGQFVGVGKSVCRHAALGNFPVHLNDVRNRREDLFKEC